MSEREERFERMLQATLDEYDNVVKKCDGFEKSFALYKTMRD